MERGLDAGEGAVTPHVQLSGGEEEEGCHGVVWQLLQYDRVNRKWVLFSLCQLTYIITALKASGHRRDKNKHASHLSRQRYKIL